MVFCAQTGKAISKANNDSVARTVDGCMVNLFLKLCGIPGDEARVVAGGVAVGGGEIGLKTEV